MENAVAVETKQSPWWLLLMSGVTSIIVGILLISSPILKTAAIAWVIGLFWFVQGIFVLINMFVDHSAWGWKLFSGIISIAAGLFLMENPVIGAVTLTATLILLLGIQGLIAGIIELVLAFKGGGWGMGIWGALSAIFGVILIANWTNPSFMLTLVWVLAVFAIIGGVAEIVLALRKRRTN